jgi:hypothetical protein
MEIVPLARRMMRINGWLGLKVLGFRPYTCTNGDQIDTETGRRIPAGSVRASYIHTSRARKAGAGARQCPRSDETAPPNGAHGIG